MGDCGWLLLPALMVRACGFYSRYFDAEELTGRIYGGSVAGCFCLPSWFEHVATLWIFVRRQYGVSRKECEIDQCASKSIIKSNQIQGVLAHQVFLSIGLSCCNYLRSLHLFIVANQSLSSMNLWASQADVPLFPHNYSI